MGAAGGVEEHGRAEEKVDTHTRDGHGEGRLLTGAFWERPSTRVIQAYWFLLLKELHKSKKGPNNIISEQITHRNMMKSE